MEKNKIDVPHSKSRRSFSTPQEKLAWDCGYREGFYNAEAEAKKLRLTAVSKAVCDHIVWLNINDIDEQCSECGDVRKR